MPRDFITEYRKSFFAELNKVKTLRVAQMCEEIVDLEKRIVILKDIIKSLECQCEHCCDCCVD